MQELEEQRSHELQLEVIRQNKWGHITTAFVWSVFWIMFLGSWSQCATQSMPVGEERQE